MFSLVVLPETRGAGLLHIAIYVCLCVSELHCFLPSSLIKTLRTSLIDLEDPSEGPNPAPRLGTVGLSAYIKMSHLAQLHLSLHNNKMQMARYASL